MEAPGELRCATSACTAQEVADWLRVTPATVFNWVKAGEMSGKKIGRTVRISRDDVLAWWRGQDMGEPLK